MASLHSPLQWLRWIARNTRRLVVLLLGAAVLGAGAAMLVLPGPGLVVILVGLAVLASEFAWAERALDRATGTAAAAAGKVAANRTGRLALVASGLSMVVGGGTVAVVLGEHRAVGVSLLVGGLIGLATLLPAVQRWLESRTSNTPSTTTSTDLAVEPATD